MRLALLATLGLVFAAAPASANFCRDGFTMRFWTGIFKTVKPMVGEQYGELSGIKLLKDGAVELPSTSGVPTTVWRITPEQFDALPWGAVLVDARTHQPLVVGIHLFDVRADFDGFMDYGFSSRIESQPFIRHKALKNLAAHGNYLHFDEYDLPLIAKAYLLVNSRGYGSGTGGEFTIHPGDRSSALTLHHHMVEGRPYGSNWLQVDAISLYIDSHYGSQNVPLMKAIAEKIGAEFKEWENGKTQYAKMILRGREQYEDYFSIRAAEQGGFAGLQARYNTWDPAGGISWYQPTFAKEFKAFLDAHRNP